MVFFFIYLFIFYFLLVKLRNFEEWVRKDFEQKLAVKSENNSSSVSSNGGNQLEERFQQYKKKMEDSSIARQLQKLFLRLQMSESRAVETKVSLSNIFFVFFSS